MPAPGQLAPFHATGAAAGGAARVLPVETRTGVAVRALARHAAQGVTRAPAVADNYRQTTNPLHLRTAEKFATFFGDWPLVDPGIVYAPAWRPDPTTPFLASVIAAPSQCRSA